MHHLYLANGLEVVLKPNHFAKMVAVQCWVHAGSIHEKDHEKGMAHVLEHMLFKGTEKRPVGVISSTVEACGGEMNAYTTFDRTVYYLTMSSEHAELSVELLADAIIHSSFDSEEYAREKEVIIEEIRRGNDSPGSRVGKKTFERMFQGTEAARPIIGYEESVRGFSRDDLVAFHKRWYVPKNMAVVLVGDFTLEDGIRWVEKYFGRQKDTPVEAKSVEPVLPHTSITADLLRGDYQQPKLELSYQIPGQEHPDTIGLDLASFALGSGDTSRFSRILRDEEGLVTGASAGIYAPDFGGIFEISLQATQETYLASIEATAREMARICLLDPVTEDELIRARANLRISRVYNDETVSGQARNLGYAVTTKHKLMYDDVIEALVEKTPQSLVQEALRRSIDLDRVAIVGLVHPEWPITEEQMVAAYNKGVANVRDSLAKSAKKSLKKSAPASRSLPAVMLLDEGVKLIYRRHEDAKLFSMVAVTAGGLRSENKDKAGFFNACSHLLAKATRHMSFEELSDFIETRGAMLEGFSGKDSIGIKMHCLGDQRSEFVPIMLQALSEPKFPEKQWASIQRELLDDIRTQDDSPSSVVIRNFQELIYGDHPYRFPVHGLEATVKSWTASHLEKSWNDWRTQQGWVIAATGSAPAEEIRSLIEANRKQWKTGHFPKTNQDKELLAKMPSSFKETRIQIPKAREQTHMVVGFKGLDWFSHDRAALDVLSSILGGSGGRLFTNLRDKESLAYSVSPIASYGVYPGVVGAYIACSPEKVERARQAMLSEFKTLCDQEVSQAELSRSIEYIVGNHEADLQRGDAQALTMALMELYGLGGDDFIEYPKAIRKVTSSDVRKLAQRLFNFEAVLSVEVGSKA